MAVGLMTQVVAVGLMTQVSGGSWSNDTGIWWQLV